VTTIQQTRKFTGVSTDESFEAGQKALQSAGFRIWKTRPLAWFLIAHLEAQGTRITANLGCRPGTEISIRLSLTAGDLDESKLEEISDRIYEYLQIELAPL
jgi:hypothetical protein